MSGGTILISDATYRQSNALAVYLKAADPSYHIVGITKPHSRFQMSYQWVFHHYYDSFVVGSFAEKIQEISHVLAIPVGNSSLKTVMLANHPHAVLPPAPAFETVLDLEDTFALARKLKINALKTFYPVSFDGLLKIPLPFPWVMKGALDSDRNIVYPVRNIEEARKRFYRIQHHFSQNEKPPIVQEYMEGPVYAYNAVYQKGVLKRHYIYRIIRQFPSTGGICTAAETVDHPIVWEYGKKILDALNWNGFASIKFKENPQTGGLTLLYIDPKPGEAVEIGLATGVNVGDLLVKIIRSEELPCDLQYKKLKFYWPMQGDLLSIFNRGSWGEYKQYLQNDYSTNIGTRGLIMSACDIFNPCS